MLTGGAHVRNYEKSAAKLLHSMGFQFQQLSRRQTEAGVTLEAEQTLLGVPVFGSGLTLSYADGQLQRVEGTFYTGSEAITRVSEQESISGADALARLLAGRRRARLGRQRHDGADARLPAVGERGHGYALRPGVAH